MCWASGGVEGWVGAIDVYECLCACNGHRYKVHYVSQLFLNLIHKDRVVTKISLDFTIFKDGTFHSLKRLDVM